MLLYIMFELELLVPLSFSNAAISSLSSSTLPRVLPPQAVTSV